MRTRDYKDGDGTAAVNRGEPTVGQKLKAERQIRDHRMKAEPQIGDHRIAAGMDMEHEITVALGQEQETAAAPELDQKQGIGVALDQEQGLTAEQAAERIQAGQANRVKDNLSKTEGQIIRDNVLTFFNLLFFLLALCLFAVKAYADMLFFGIVVVNTLIGIVQELRVKRTLDRISLLASRDAAVVRDGVLTALPPDQLVLDDVVIFGSGSQICADAVVCHGCVEVNEALLTGESDVIAKGVGDHLLSGSFISAGCCTARLERVGEASYAAGITGEAKRRKKCRSQMMRSLDGLLKWIGMGIIPVGLIMFFKQIALPDTGVPYAVSSTVASMAGMIPEGLYLLVSIALALSVIKLAKCGTLVHELSSIENLARVDVLCLDKTGTITEGRMKVVELVPLDGTGQEVFEQLLSQYVHSSECSNGTAQALKEYFVEGVRAGDGGLEVAEETPFSSERKWGSLRLTDGRTYVLGAPEVVLGKAFVNYKYIASRFFEGGHRVLLLAESGAGVRAPEFTESGPGVRAPGFTEFGAGVRPVEFTEFGAGARAPEFTESSAGVRPLGFAVLADKVRDNAGETLQYFKEQGVAIKVISGDNAGATAAIAKRAGVEGADCFLDMEQFDLELQDLDPDSPERERRLAAAAEGNAVFGRVSPRGKRELIRGLKCSGHTVAMIGDGVNDVLALKEADCSIAMAAGSDAAQHVSQMVLLHSDFSAMPQIVKEGRRVINNIQRSASLFLVKNIYSFFITLILLFAAMPYPFVPIQLTLLSGLLIGVPSFLLTLESSYERIRGKFLRNILLNALPGGLVSAVLVLTVLWTGVKAGLAIEEISTVCTLLTGVNGLLVLIFLCWPLNLLRFLMTAVMGIGFFGAAVLLAPLFRICPLSDSGWEIFMVFASVSPLLMGIVVFAISRLKKRLEDTGPEMRRKQSGSRRRRVLAG